MAPRQEGYARQEVFVDCPTPRTLGQLRRTRARAGCGAYRDYAAARDISKAIKEQIKEKDVKVVIDEYFPAGTADFSSQIAKGQQLQPDLWIGLLYPSEAIETVRQFHAMNYMPGFFIANGVSQEDFVTAAGKDAEYALGMSLYEP